MFHVITLRDMPDPPLADEPWEDTGMAMAEDEAAIPTTPKRLANPDPAVRCQNFDLVRTDELQCMPFVFSASVRRGTEWMVPTLPTSEITIA